MGIPGRQVRPVVFKCPRDRLSVHAAAVRAPTRECGARIILQRLPLAHIGHKGKVHFPVLNFLFPALGGIVREAAVDGERSPCLHVEPVRGDVLVIEVHINAVKPRRVVVRLVVDQVGPRNVLGREVKLRLIGLEERPAVLDPIPFHAQLNAAEVPRRDGLSQRAGQRRARVGLPKRGLGIVRVLPLVLYPPSIPGEAHLELDIHGQRRCGGLCFPHAHREARDVAIFVTFQTDVGHTGPKLFIRTDEVRQGPIPLRIPCPVNPHAAQPRVGLALETAQVLAVLVDRDVLSVLLDPSQAKRPLGPGGCVVHIHQLTVMPTVAVLSTGDDELPLLGLRVCVPNGLKAKEHPGKPRRLVGRLVVNQPGLRPMMEPKVGVSPRRRCKARQQGEQQDTA